MLQIRRQRPKADDGANRGTGAAPFARVGVSYSCREQGKDLLPMVIVTATNGQTGFV